MGSKQPPSAEAAPKARDSDPVLANPSGRAGYQRGLSRPESRSAFEATFVNPDGTRTTQVSS